jgi:hypothetical protein
MSRQDDDSLQEVITQLQSIMLSSVLRQRPLPGLTQPVRFPDLAFITDAPTVLISDDNVPSKLDTADFDRPVKVMPETEIRAEAGKSGDHAYVRFQPAEEMGDQIRIVMEVRLAPTESYIQTLGLGGIRATFAQRPDGNWQAIEPPAMFGI